MTHRMSYTQKRYNDEMLAFVLAEQRVAIHRLSYRYEKVVILFYNR